MPVNFFWAFRESVDPLLLDHGFAQKLPPHFFLVKATSRLAVAEEEPESTQVEETGDGEGSAALTSSVCTPMSTRGVATSAKAETQ